MKRECPGIDVQVFSDRDIADKRAEMEAALQGADMFFGSLLFDYDQVLKCYSPEGQGEWRSRGQSSYHSMHMARAISMTPVEGPYSLSVPLAITTSPFMILHPHLL